LASHVSRHAAQENVATITATLAWRPDLTLGRTTFHPGEVRCDLVTDGLANCIGYLPPAEYEVRYYEQAAVA
jgi:hypothetical protein